MKGHVGNIFAKLGARDRAAAIVLAYDAGLVAARRLRTFSGTGLVGPIRDSRVAQPAVSRAELPEKITSRACRAQPTLMPSSGIRFTSSWSTLETQSSPSP